MATIRTIRKRSGLVIAAIGVAMVAFIVSDALQSNKHLFSDQKTGVGVIGGDEIPVQQFEEKLNKVKSDYLFRTGKKKIDAATQGRLRNQAWEGLVFEILFGEEYRDLHLTVTDKEVLEFVQGDNVHPSVKKAFTNPNTGKFDRNRLIRFLKSLEQEPTSPQAKESRRRWLEFEKALYQERRQTKYFELIKRSFYATDLEARNVFKNENQYASFDYIGLLLSSIPDSLIQVDKSEIEKYYRENKEDYKQDPSRTLEYIYFDILPTKEDTLAAREWIEDEVPHFRKADDDSLYIELNSDQPFDTSYHPRGELSEKIEDSMFNGDTGTMVGPYFEDGAYKVSKLLAIKNVDTVNYYYASHILIKPEGSTDEDTAKSLEDAKELMQRIREGASFEALAQEHSTGPSASKGGDLGWFEEGSMVPNFNNAVKEMDVGELRVVKTKFGAHLIKKHSGPSNRMVKVATLVREIYPGPETFKNMYSKAAKFRSKISSEEDFNDAVKTSGLNKRLAEDLKPNQQFIPGFTDASPMIQWAYRNNEGDVSEILEVDDRYVVAHLSEVNEEGYEPVYEVKNEIEGEVIKNKKLDQLAERLKESSQGSQDLQEIAGKVDKRVKTASQINFKSSVVPGIGSDQILIGYLFGWKEDKITPVIRGTEGVYKVRLNNMTDVEPPEMLMSSKNKVFAEKLAKSRTAIIEALKDATEIKDYRYRFY